MVLCFEAHEAFLLLLFAVFLRCHKILAFCCDQFLPLLTVWFSFFFFSLIFFFQIRANRFEILFEILFNLFDFFFENFFFEVYKKYLINI